MGYVYVQVTIARTDGKQSLPEGPKFCPVRLSGALCKATNKFDKSVFLISQLDAFFNYW